MAYYLVVSTSGGVVVASSTTNERRPMSWPYSVITLTRQRPSSPLYLSEYPRYPPSRPPTMGKLTVLLVTHAFLCSSYCCHSCKTFVERPLGAKTALHT